MIERFGAIVVGRVLPILLAGATAAAEGGSSQTHHQMQGCWQMEEIVLTKLSGEVTRRKIERECREWIAEGKIRSACRDALGLVRSSFEHAYQLLDGTTMKRDYATPEEVTFTSDGRLRRTVVYKEVAASARIPDPEARKETYYVRAAADAESCLPTSPMVPAREAWKVWRGPELARESVGALWELELAMSLRDRETLRIPANALRPEDRARAVRELSKAMDRGASRGMADTRISDTALEKVWSEKRVCSDHQQTLYLASPEVQRWAADTVTETIALQHVAARVMAATSVFPEESKRMLDFKSVVTKNVEDKLKHGLILELLLVPRAVVVLLAEHPEMAQAFDPKTDFVALRDLGRRNVEFFDKNGLQYSDILRCPGGLAGNTPRPEEDIRKGIELQWKQDLDLLRTRIDYASDQNVNGMCAHLVKDIDVASFRASNGDYRLVRSSTGSPLAAGATELLSLSMAYSRGCWVERDMRAARRMLEGFSTASTERGKVTIAAWCLLANWNRYGFGGAQDERQALAWENRVVEQISKQGCRRMQAVDPADPWREIRR